MEFHAIKPGITYYGCEVYKIEIDGRMIRGKYLGKMLSRREKAGIILKSIFYALLGGYFFGTPGYAMAVLASPDIKAKIGEPEEDASKDFCYSMEQVRIKINARKGILKIKGEKKWKFFVEKGILEKISKVI